MYLDLDLPRYIFKESPSIFQDFASKPTSTYSCFQCHLGLIQNLFSCDYHQVRVGGDNPEPFVSLCGQVMGTALAIGYFTYLVSGVSGPAAIVIGNGLALSSTAVVLQVCFPPTIHF